MRINLGIGVRNRLRDIFRPDAIDTRWFRSTPASEWGRIRRGYDLEDEAAPLIGYLVNRTQLSYERLVNLYENVAYLERIGIEGCLVECGVWKGGAAGMMALANLRNSPDRRVLHLFDSFQGMPDARVEVDGADAVRWVQGTGMGALVSTGINVASPDDVRSLLVDTLHYPTQYVQIHPGWFQQTLPEFAKSVGPIALLRLDGDFYDSTRVALETLYPSVSAGGLIVVDDYGHFEGCKRAVDEFLADEAPTAYLHYIDYTGRYFFKS